MLGFNYYFDGGEPKPFKEYISPFAATDLYGGVDLGQDVGSTSYVTSVNGTNDYKFYTFFPLYPFFCKS